jgi:hypothetical protein
MLGSTRLSRTIPNTTRRDRLSAAAWWLPLLLTDVGRWLGLPADRWLRALTGTVYITTRRWSLSGNRSGHTDPLLAEFGHHAGAGDVCANPVLPGEGKQTLEGERIETIRVLTLRLPRGRRDWCSFHALDFRRN